MAKYKSRVFEVIAKRQVGKRRYWTNGGHFDVDTGDWVVKPEGEEYHRLDDASFRKMFEPGDDEAKKEYEEEL